MPRWIHLALPLVTLASYVLLAGIFGPRISQGAGGLLPFDLRPLGYGLDEAQAFLSALTPEARALYLGPVRVNDSVFPILFTLCLCLPLGGWGWLWFLPALAYGLLDLAENLAVATLLSSDPGAVTAGPVALASAMTMAKFAAVAMAVLLALVALIGKWRAR